MKVGDMVCWQSDLMYGMPDENPMIIIEQTRFSSEVRIISPSSGWSHWVSEVELYVVSSSDSS